MVTHFHVLACIFELAKAEIGLQGFTNMSVHQLTFYILVFIPLMTLLGYYLGKRKTQTPKIVAGLVCMASLLPPLGLILLFILALKGDLSSEHRQQEDSSGA